MAQNLAEYENSFTDELALLLLCPIVTQHRKAQFLTKLLNSALCHYRERDKRNVISKIERDAQEL
ncbi:hypothetical protein AB8989_05905 [Yersinia hibernica]|uniref:Uncharacterized protein n=1 Tax=Yersinia hibernica TaxID=2339259 RepID=A0ABX5R0E2_9GAMM|nr:hypothetical protein [Yersinia hibernica]QAX79047.1 hypothetical protein D5F51_11045 [Yersinia hibernica]